MRGVSARRTTVHTDGWLRVGCRHAIAIDITTVDGIIFVFSLLRNTLMKENPAFSLFGRSGFSNGDQMSVVSFSQIAACLGYTDVRDPNTN